MHTAPLISTIPLAAGQGLSLRLRRGDRLWLSQGCLQVRPPAQWLGERCWQPSATWVEGHQQQIDDAGEWQWQALTAVTLRLERRPTPWTQLAAALAGLRVRWPGRPARVPSPPGT
ncbi:hypothetical protein KGA65_17910 [Ideonella sp. B7]|uniref:hypothetical protein n=1 Tax=Ideonella benzenivorans TaxID=2831643 RepID=UPI001CEDD289|nr:hypothetical protein [Ideonella benzenivorans]MCA6218416.1 hypothetical protein [Ideonella benzenivorans]